MVRMAKGNKNNVRKAKILKFRKRKFIDQAN